MAWRYLQCIIIYTGCDMCSSCIVEYFMCVPSYCEVCTHSICCRVGCAPPVHRSGAALAAVALAAVARTGMQQPHSVLSVLGPEVPVSSLQFSHCLVAFGSSSARLYSGLHCYRRAFSPVRRRSTCSGGTGRDRSAAREPSSAPPSTRECSSRPC